MTLLRRDYALDRRRANRVARAFRLAVSDSNLAGIRLSAADPRQRHPDGVPTSVGARSNIPRRQGRGRPCCFHDHRG